MQKVTVALLAGTAALAAGMWFLPRGSVQQRAAVADSAKSAKSVASDEATPLDADTTAGSHAAVLSSPDLALVRQWQKALPAATKEQKIILVDSLANLFTARGKFDSALVYREQTLAVSKSAPRLLAAGEAAYMAYAVASNPDLQKAYAAKAQQYLTSLLAIEPNQLQAKIHLALTYVGGSTPMQGITLLREVVAKDPDNQEALYQLGILSLQSGQYAKAAARFNQILAKHPDDTKTRFYLALAYKELGDAAKARQELEFVQAHETDPAVQATVRDYLTELKTP